MYILVREIEFNDVNVSNCMKELMYGVFFHTMLSHLLHYKYQ